MSNTVVDRSSIMGGHFRAAKAVVNKSDISNIHMQRGIAISNDYLTIIDPKSYIWYTQSCFDDTLNYLLSE